MSLDVCPYCRKTVRVNKDGTLRVHGPRNKPCYGAFLLPFERDYMRSHRPRIEDAA